MKFKIIYKAPISIKLDKMLQTAMESVGAEWTGQGIETATGIRDISFEIEAPE